MQKGTLISGAGHAALILWVVLGDWLFAPQDAPPVQVAEVSLISTAAFDAMVAAAPSTPEPLPAAEPAPEPSPQPETVVEPPPVQPDVPTPQPEPQPAPVPEPEPLPEPELQPEPLPQNNGVADAEPLPVDPDPVPEVALPPTTSPRPKPAPRVAPIPVDTPDPVVEVAEAPVEAVSPEPTPEPQVVQPEQPPVAQEEAGTVLETEANRDEVVVASGAPKTSPRPKGRPVRAATPTQTTEAPAATNDSVADAIADAVAEAVSTPAPTGATNAPQGPPITSGEKDALRVAVQQCWNVGSLSSDALRVTVIVGLSVAQTGVPEAGSIRMVEFTDGTEAAARQAFEAARRAIIRCGARGFPLPQEKYEQWREMELVFNPNGMRLR